MYSTHMHVELRLPVEWAVAIAPDGSVRATSAEHAEIEVSAAPLSVVVDRKTEWARAMMCQALGCAPDKLVLRVDEVGETTDAWPAWFTVAERSDTGEVRAFAFYYFLDYASFASVRGPNAAVHLALLRNARPDYATPAVVALEQLWE